MTAGRENPFGGHALILGLILLAFLCFHLYYRFDIIETPERRGDRVIGLADFHFGLTAGDSVEALEDALQDLSHDGSYSFGDQCRDRHI